LEERTIFGGLEEDLPGKCSAVGQFSRPILCTIVREVLKRNKQTTTKQISCIFVKVQSTPEDTTHFGFFFLSLVMKNEPPFPPPQVG
jgi:hypothetical protein